MQIEVIEKIKNSERSIKVEQTESNFINFYLNKKKEQFEVEMYVFKEHELLDLVQKQEEIYKRMESINSEKNILERIKYLVVKLGDFNKVLQK